MKFEKGKDNRPDPRALPIPGISRADMRYWMRWFEKIEPNLTEGQKLSYIRAVTVALIHVCKPAAAVESQRRYNEKKAKNLLESIVAKRRKTSVTTSVNAAAPSENSSLPREEQPPKPPEGA